ncbi:MAG: hypothetical protein Q7V58_04765 [Actinomycetota bacterium]|nr:hypothetical protein [Actinomycetota bacterium]
MDTAQRATGVPPEILIRPTLMITGRSAAAIYRQPAAELARLARAGVIVKIAHGYYAAVPTGRQRDDWIPSLETLSAGLATAVFGPGGGAIWGLSAARVHGALPRATATGYVLGPTQHRDIELSIRSARVEFSKRDPARLDLEYLATELGPSLVTSIHQTILDLSTRPFEDGETPRADAVRALMERADLDRLAGLAANVRGRTALARALRLARHAA